METATTRLLSSTRGNCRADSDRCLWNMDDQAARQPLIDYMYKTGKKPWVISRPVTRLNIGQELVLRPVSNWVPEQI